MRKVLFIVYYFPPMGLSGVQRPLKFAKYLREFGWEPVILTTGDTSFYAFDKSLEEELENENFSIYRTNTKKSTHKAHRMPPYFIQKMGRYIKSFYKFPDSKSSWKKPALKLADKIIVEHDIQAVWATAPPFTNFLIGREISEKYHLPLTIDYRDSWVDNKFNFYPTAYHKNKAIKMENAVINTADKIVVISRYAKELLIRRYKILNYEDVDIIPHGYDEKDLSEFRSVTPNPDKFTIVHLGSFLDDRNPKFFFKAIKKFLKKNKEASENFRLIIIGASRKNHEKMPKKFKIEKNVEFIPYLPHQEAVEYLFKADILWLLLNDNIRTPGKLYEYFGTGKPLLITAPDGNMKELAKKTKACLTANPEDVKEIEKAIASYYKLWQDNSLPVADSKFTSKYNRKNLTGELAKLLNNSVHVS